MGEEERGEGSSKNEEREHVHIKINPTINVLQSLATVAGVRLGSRFSGRRG